MDGCYYISTFGTVFGWTQLLPLIVTLFCIYFLYGLYLYIPQLMLWFFQDYYKIDRPNPICQLYHTYAFPSLEAMYMGSLLGAFFTYAYYWKTEQSWMSWLCIHICGSAVPLILIYSGYNRWDEVLISMGVGFLFSMVFIISVRLFIRPNIQYLHLHFPFYQFGYHSDLIKKDAYNVEILKSLLKVEGVVILE